MSRRAASPGKPKPPSGGVVIAILLAIVAAISGLLAWKQRPEARAQVPRALPASASPVAAPGASAAIASMQGAPHQAEGRRLVQQGRVGEAIAAFERARSLEPGNPIYMTDLGAALLQSGDSLGAEAMLARALEVAPGNVMALTNIGLASLALGRGAEAESAFRDAITRSGDAGPQAARAHDGLGQLLLRRAARPGGMDPALVEQAIAEGRASVRISDSIPGRLHLADSLLAALDGDGAIEQLRAAARLAPRDPNPLIRISQAQFEMDRLDDAEAAARQAIARDASSLSARLALGIVLEVKGEDAAALPELRQAASADHAGRADATHRLARVARRLGLDDEADKAQASFEASSPDVEDLKDKRRQAATSPTSAIAQYNLGVALERAGDRDGAFASLQRAVALDPALAAAHANLGILFLGRGALAPAERSLRRALELEPANAAAGHGLGAVLLKRGDFPGSVAALEAALATEPDRDAARLDLAMALANAGRVSDARKQLERLVVKDRRNVTARINLAELLRHLGDRAGAMAQLREVLKVDPAHAEAKRRLDDLSK